MKQVRQSVPLVTLVSENREIIYDSETRLLCGLQAQALAATAETARPLFHALRLAYSRHIRPSSSLDRHHTTTRVSYINQRAYRLSNYLRIS